jgi:hypothetical protein
VTVRIGVASAFHGRSRAESQVLAGRAVGIFFAGSFVLVVYIDDD